MGLNIVGSVVGLVSVLLGWDGDSRSFPSWLDKRVHHKTLYSIAGKQNTESIGCITYQTHTYMAEGQIRRYLYD